MSLTVQTTKNYAQFEMHETNRVLTDASGFVPRKDLIKSMKKDGFWPAAPILCSTMPKGKLKIFEGHNRFVTAQFLGIPVHYIAYPPHLAKTPKTFSEGIAPWKYADIAKSCAQDNPDYAEVMQFHESTGISLAASFSLFHGDSAGSGNANSFVKSGTFKIRDRSAPWLVAAIVASLGKYSSHSTSVYLVGAISKAIRAEGFNVGRMLERIDKAPELVKPCRSLTEYLDMLELIYNRNMKGDRYHLRIEVEKAMRLRGIQRAAA